MNGLYRNKNKEYFAASNTKDGFVSYFDEIFGPKDCDRVLLLKGGPGVGKSTFMKKVKSVCEKNGLSTECFYCSSDPKSLDGIIIREKRIAVVDGTNPHAVEPTLAGAREIIVDLGRAWDTEKLFEHKDEILRLGKNKQQHYKDCYNFLYSKSVIDGLVYNLIFPNILFDKLDTTAARLSKNLCKGVRKKTNPESKTRITNAISSLGKIRLFSFENMAECCIFLKEPFSASNLSHIFLRAVYEYMKSLGVDSYVSLSPENKNEIDALFFPEISVSISLYDDSLVAECDKNLKKCRIINCSRFLDTKQLSLTKPLRKFYCKLSANMQNCALEALKKAGEAHADLEKIYRQCTDYTTVEKISNEYFDLILNMKTPRQ